MYVCFQKAQHITTVCPSLQAHPRRVAKVAKQIEREVGSLLITDRVLQEAVCPERKRGMDGALSALVSVTDVRLSNDLQVAKVFLSIYSDEVGRMAATASLQRLEPYVRHQIGQTVRLRLTPEIRFVVDDSIERSERVFKLLDMAKAIEAGTAEPPPIAFRDYGEEEEDDEDGGSIVPVDLGFFEGEPEEEEGDDTMVEGIEDEEFFDMTPDEVEAMMELFRQESAAGSLKRRKSSPNTVKKKKTL